MDRFVCGVCKADCRDVVHSCECAFDCTANVATCETGYTAYNPPHPAQGMPRDKCGCCYCVKARQEDFDYDLAFVDPPHEHELLKLEDAYQTAKGWAYQARQDPCASLDELNKAQRDLNVAADRLHAASAAAEDGMKKLLRRSRRQRR